jgi:hypothetical protein
MICEKDFASSSAFTFSLSSSISLGSLLFFDDTIKTKKKITDGEEN